MQSNVVIAVFVIVACVSALDVPLMRIGLVADNHYDTFPAGEKAPWQPLPHWFQEQIRRTTNVNKRRYDVARDKMDEAIDVFNRVENMTMVVNLGDLVNNDLMWNLRPILDSFNRATAPHYNILGNHDLRAHNDRFGKDNKTQHNWIREKMGTGDEWFFALSYPPFKLIFVDSMIMEPENKNMTRKREHIAWLEAQIEEARRLQQVVIVFAHIPIGFNTNPFLGPVMKSYEHIIAAFFGHDHKGGYIKQQGTHCVTLQGQIETLTNSFAVVDVFVDRIELTGFGRVPSRVMALEPATVALLRGFRREALPPERFNLAAQGHQPQPPELLWRNEVLQKPPPLQLNIPNYRKPTMGATEPNPGDTQFLRFEYKSWPRRLRTPSPEEPVDLTSAKNGHPTILSPAPDALRDTAPRDLEQYSERTVQQTERITPVTRAPAHVTHELGEIGLGRHWMVTPAFGLALAATLLCAVMRRRRVRSAASSGSKSVLSM